MLIRASMILWDTRSNLPPMYPHAMPIARLKKVATTEALKYVRENGPFLLEAMTYRYQGHSMGDPERYRTKEEVTKWEENDPIGIFHKHLVDNKVASQQDLEQIEKEVDDQIEDAVQFAEDSPEPTWQELVDSVYVEGVG